MYTRRAKHSKAETARNAIFNRTREIKNLTEHFSRDHDGTELTLITGPPDSGKTLLTEVMKACERERQLSWFHIDMRDPSHLWNSVDGVYKILYRCFAPRIATISKMIESMIPQKSVTFSIPGVQLNEKLVTVKDVQDLLTYAENDLSAASKSGLKPVLFID